MDGYKRGKCSSCGGFFWPPLKTDSSLALTCWYQILQQSIRGQAESRSDWAYTRSWGSLWRSVKFWEKLQGKHLVSISSAVWCNINAPFKVWEFWGVSVLTLLLSTCTFRTARMSYNSTISMFTSINSEYKTWFLYLLRGTLVPVAAGGLSTAPLTPQNQSIYPMAIEDQSTEKSCSVRFIRSEWMLSFHR